MLEILDLETRGYRNQRDYSIQAAKNNFQGADQVSLPSSAADLHLCFSHVCNKQAFSGWGSCVLMEKLINNYDYFIVVIHPFSLFIPPAFMLRGI